MNIKTGKGLYTFSKKCRVTGKEFSLTVSGSKYEDWRNGFETIQSVFPELKPGEREFLISGTTPEEWDALMKDLD